MNRSAAFLLLAALLWLIAACQSGKKPAGPDAQLIRAARARSNAAIAAADTLALAKEWTADYHLISSRNSEVAGLEKNRHLFALEFSTKKEVLYVRSPRKVEVFPQWGMASEEGVWTGRWREPDGMVRLRGTYLAKWHRLDGQWKIRAEIFVPLSCEGSAFCEKNPLK